MSRILPIISKSIVNSLIYFLLWHVYVRLISLYKCKIASAFFHYATNGYGGKGVSYKRTCTPALSHIL